MLLLPLPLGPRVRGDDMVCGSMLETRGASVEKPVVLGLLLVATILEAGGDAVVRAGLHRQAIGSRTLLFLLGGLMLFCYGVVLNKAPFDFGRLIGAYVATFFVVAQIINLIAFGRIPNLPVVLGGLFIIAGGLIITFWESAS